MVHSHFTIVFANSFNKLKDMIVCHSCVFHMVVQIRKYFSQTNVPQNTSGYNINNTPTLRKLPLCRSQEAAKFLLSFFTDQDDTLCRLEEATPVFGFKKDRVSLVLS